MDESDSSCDEENVEYCVFCDKNVGNLRRHQYTNAHKENVLNPVSPDVFLYNSAFNNTKTGEKRIANYVINNREEDEIDINEFFNKKSPTIYELIAKNLDLHKGIKFSISVNSDFKKNRRNNRSGIASVDNA